MIAEGRIALNGETLKTPATLLTDLGGVTVDGKAVRPPAATRLFRFYKPQGTLTAANDPKGRPTIYDRLPPGLPRVMPVGRLDFMTEGLLLLTNDGEFKRKLELPSTAVVRQYRARAFGTVTQDQLERLAEGVTIEGMRYGPIIANLERRTGRNCWIEMSLTEGLLLLTNDGEFKRKLELPSTAVVRQYRARAFGTVTQDQLERLAEGVTIEGMRYGPIIANLERRTGRNCWIEMSLTEGKNREVRNVLGFLGLQVSRLIRTAYGPLDVSGMEPGDADEVSQAELDALRASLK